MKHMIMMTATLLMALLIFRQQEHNLTWEVQLAEEAYGEATAVHAALESTQEAMAAEPLPRRVLTKEQREALDAFMGEQQGNWSVYLLDITSGEQYLYNEGAMYYPASLLKAPYAYWLALKADEGELRLAQKIPNCKRGALAGSDLEKYNSTKTITVMAALRAMISHSSNDAVTLLANQWAGTAENGFNDFLKELGYTNADTVRIDGREGIQGIVTVEDVGTTMKALYDYFDSDAPNAYDLKRCFIEADHRMLYVPEQTLTAKKYGSWQFAYHDAAIVYGKFPYILCVMSDQGLEAVDFPEEPTETMQQLGKLVWKILEE